MTLLKSNEIERYLIKPNFGNIVHLIYGPDRGLAAERSALLAKASGVDLNDPFSTIKLDSDALSADPDRLMNEAYTVSMFGGARLIWLRGVTNNASLVKQLEQVLNNPPENTYCIFEAGDLKKGSKIRDMVERAKNACAVPCYADGARNIAAILDEELTKNRQTIGLEARQYLLSLLGADRGASRSEIEKLSLYTAGKPQIEYSDITDILGDASAISTDAITDAVITGNLQAFDRSIAKFFASGTSSFLLFSAMIRQFQALEKMRADMDVGGKNASQAISLARPPVFFARKSAIETALKKWPGKAIRAAHDRLQSALLESRKHNNLDSEIAHMALLALTIQASRSR